MSKNVVILVQRMEKEKSLGLSPQRITLETYASPFNSLLPSSGELVGGLDQILGSHVSTILQLPLESTVLHPFYAKIGMYILHTILRTFSIALTERSSGVTTKSVSSLRSFP